jgi:membrane-associated phospholipid phosphatase
VRNIDRFLFFGTDPSVWLQRHFYDSSNVRWYDVVGSVVYFSHFVVPTVVIVVLWITDRLQWVRWMRRMATVLAIACIAFVLVPTVPPWLAGEGGYHALPTLARPAGRGWFHVGLGVFTHAWSAGRKWTNPIAAMPSLHAAMSMLVVVFFWPRISSGWMRAVLATYPLLMALSLVYFAEHYVADVLGGWIIVGGVCLVLRRIETRGSTIVATTEDLQQPVGV